MEEKGKTRSLLKPSRRMNPAAEHLVAMLIEENRRHPKGDKERKALLDLSLIDT